MRFRVAVAQIAPRKADVAANLDRIAEVALQASGEGTDVLVFPETIVSGYFVEGGVLEVARSIEDLEFELAARLKGLTRPLDLVIGFYERAEGHLYNSSAYLEATAQGVKAINVYRKVFLPTYGVFDEERFVSPGNALSVFETRFGPSGMLICEDVWHSIMPTLVALKGGKVLYVPAASPARNLADSLPGNHERYRRLMKTMAEEHGIFAINSLLLGFEGGKGFSGGSSIIDPEGRVLVECPLMEEHLGIAEIDLDAIQVARAHAPMLSDLQTRWPLLARFAQELSAGDGSADEDHR